MALDGSIRIGAVVDSKEFQSSFERLGSVAKKGLAGMTAATGAAGVAIGKLTKDSTEAYAEYEQLVGGVETLFKTSSEKVMEYANNAYKTAGLSANQYMETVTSFSASLLQSLGGDTEKAATIADQAIVDMADNANKMGTSMESIQNAYQGFAKQNYTMLDNLKLGYGGTKEEMERLLADAEQLSGIHFDISSFSDIVEAIHVVQSDLGITGTTAEETASTIDGSIASMRSAWQNLVAGIGNDNADLGKLMGEFTSSFETAMENLIPRIEIILTRIGEMVTQLAPIIAEKLPEMMETILPPLIQAAGTLIQGLAGALPELLTVLTEAIRQAIDSIGHSLAEKVPFLAGLFENLGAVVTAAAVAFVTLKAATLAYQVASSITKVIQMLTVATEGQTIAQGLLNAVMNANPFVLIATAIVGVVTALMTLWATSEGFRNAINSILKTIGDGIQWVIDKVMSLIDWFRELFGVSSSASPVSVTDYGGSGRSYSPRMAAYAGEISAYSLNDLPHLAQGAVISPNSEFLAVLGDQRSGTNVEAPLATIKQGFMETLHESGLLNQNRGGGPGVVELSIDGQKFARLIYPYNQSEQRRMGVDLVRG